MKNGFSKLTSLVIIFMLFCSVISSEAAAYGSKNGKYYTETVIITNSESTNNKSDISAKNLLPNNVVTTIRAYDDGKVELIVTNQGLDSVDRYNVVVNIQGTPHDFNIVPLRIGSTTKSWNAPMGSIRDTITINGSTSDGSWWMPISASHERYNFIGGAYGRISSLGGHVHHCPAKSINGLTEYSGPSIRMLSEDHRQTASYGGGSAAYLAKQREYISKGEFLKAQQMDIDDIRSKFGNKYDGAIAQMLDYTINELGYKK